MTNITLFSQIISKLDRSKFNKLVKVKQTDKHCKGYTSWTHLVSMLFCRFAKRQSVRNISNGLHSSTGNLNHLGIDKAPSKSSISYQNKHILKNEINCLKNQSSESTYPGKLRYVSFWDEENNQVI